MTAFRREIFVSNVILHECMELQYIWANPMRGPILHPYTSLTTAVISTTPDPVRPGSGGENGIDHPVKVMH